MRHFAPALLALSLATASFATAQIHENGTPLSPCGSGDGKGDYWSGDADDYSVSDDFGYISWTDPGQPYQIYVSFGSKDSSGVSSSGGSYWLSPPGTDPGDPVDNGGGYFDQNFGTGTDISGGSFVKLEFFTPGGTLIGTAYGHKLPAGVKTCSS